jgi:hypothetical protein
MVTLWYHFVNFLIVIFTRDVKILKFVGIFPQLSAFLYFMILCPDM